MHAATEPAPRSALVRKGAVAAVDQAILSAAGFATAVLLACSCAKAEFGLYAFVLMLQLLAAGLAGSFVTRPLTVLGSSMTPRAFRGYVASASVWQLVVGAASAALLLVAAAVSASVDSWRIASGALAWSAATTVTWQGREFVRQVLFAEQRASAVLVNDALNAAGTLGALVVLATSGGLDAAAVFQCSAAVGAATLAIGLVQIRRAFDFRALDLRAAGRRNVAYGRWAAVITVAGFATTQLPVLVFPAFTGLVGLAAIEAARHVLAPVTILRTASGNLLMPRAARVFADRGRDSLHAFVTRTLGLVGALSVAYAAVAAAAPEWMLSLLYGDRFAGAGAYVLLWVFVQLVSHGSFTASVGLEAMRRPDVVGRVAVASAIAFLALLGACVPLFGAHGVLVAWGVTELGRALVLVSRYAREGIEGRPVVGWGT